MVFHGVFLSLSLPSPPYPGGSFQPNERQAVLGTLSLHGKELSGICYPEVGRPGNPRARGPMGKGRLVPLPESACLCVCCVLSPDLLSPFSSSVGSLHPFLLFCFLSGLSILLSKSPSWGSPNSPHAIGWVQSGQVLLPGATATTSRFLSFPERVRTWQVGP